MGSRTRRAFLRDVGWSSGFLASGVGGLLPGLRPVAADEAKIDPQIVQFQPDIEPLVRLLESTPRDRVIEEVAARVRQGLGYRELLAALLLAGVRNIQPRPAVGFKFHAVLVVNSAHLASLAAPSQDRWLPIFWAIDTFKSSQARDVEEGNWTMAPVNESQFPADAALESSFASAMEQWDEAAADRAIAGLVRTRGANRLFELLARWGARDFRSIGHKAIFVANSFRTLQTIGWQYAEPVLRSVVYALLNHEGEPNPSQADLVADRPWRWNQEMIRAIPPSWQQGRQDDGATRQLLSAFRVESAEAVDRMIVDALKQGVSVQSIYDAIYLASSEWLTRQPGIVSLHATTTTNAMRYAFEMSADEETRKLLLLQNAAFVVMFRDEMQRRGVLEPQPIDQWSLPVDSLTVDAAGLFATLNTDRKQAATQLLVGLQQGLSPEEVMRVARRLIFLKGDDSHDYKFSSAVMEDYYHISPTWRNHVFAASVYKLRGADEPTNGLIERIGTA